MAPAWPASGRGVPQGGAATRGTVAGGTRSSINLLSALFPFGFDSMPDWPCPVEGTGQSRSEPNRSRSERLAGRPASVRAPAGRSAIRRPIARDERARIFSVLNNDQRSAMNNDRQRADDPLAIGDDPSAVRTIRTCPYVAICYMLHH
jgi:hypothetical protein